ncbi:MAG: DJ-1 family glyoxalase III [Puniceicoccaceae bacterium]
MSEPTALVILTDGVEELEAVAPIDCLRRASVQTTVASATQALQVEGRNGIHLVADTLLDACFGHDYDLLVIPGGPGHATMAADSRILQMLQQQDQAGRLIGSICAGPVVLDQAGVLEGKAYTSYPGTSEQLPDRRPDEEVVRDGNIITSQGAGTATAFALALVEALCGEDKAREISRSICA